MTIKEEDFKWFVYSSASAIAVGIFGAMLGLSSWIVVPACLVPTAILNKIIRGKWI